MAFKNNGDTSALAGPLDAAGVAALSEVPEVSESATIYSLVDDELAQAVSSSGVTTNGCLGRI